MVKSTIFIILLLAILSSTTYAITSSDGYLQCVTERILKDCISVYEIQNFINESIFNFLKNFENELPKGNFVFRYPKGKEVLVCEIPDDFKRLVKHDANKYSLDYSPSKESPLIDCPTTIVTYINETVEKYNYKFEFNIFNFSLFSITLISITIIFFIIKKHRTSKKSFKVYKK